MGASQPASQAKYFSGITWNSLYCFERIEMPCFPKILNPGHRKNAICATCFQALKHHGAPGRPPAASSLLSAQNPLHHLRSLQVPYSGLRIQNQTIQPNLQTLHLPYGSLRQKYQPLSPGRNMADSTQGSPLKLSPPSPFWVPYISPIYFWVNLPIVLLPTVN